MFLANAKRDSKGRLIPGWHPGMCSARTEAKSKGLKRYVGEPCPHGHTERFTSTGKCCECKRLDARARYKADPERYRAYSLKGYHNQSPEKLAKARAKFAANRQAWEKANPDLVKAGKKRHRLANMDRWRSYVRNRRARLKGVPGWHNHEDIARLREKQNDQCLHCRADLHGKGEVDHITALSRGGTNWPHNLQLLCMPCNRKKHAKDPVVHARAIGLLPAAPAADGAQQEV